MGRPKQLLPFAGATLLDHTVATARACEFDQLIVALGGDAGKVRARVDLSGTQVVINPGFGAGCSSSIAVAMGALDPDATTVLVLMLGDQPGVMPAIVRVLLAARGDAPIAVCRYDDGRGHPFAFGRTTFERAPQPPRRQGGVADARRARRRGRGGAGRGPGAARRRHLGGLRGRRRGLRKEQRMTGWTVGLILGIVVVLVAAAIVIMIVRLAAGSPQQAETAEGAVEVVRQQTAELGGIGRINDSGVRILHSARALRKVAVGK